MAPQVCILSGGSALALCGNCLQLFRPSRTKQKEEGCDATAPGSAELSSECRMKLWFDAVGLSSADLLPLLLQSPNPLLFQATMLFTSDTFERLSPYLTGGRQNKHILLRN